jgi:uncharacterized protein involved in exopolysaccharide biosynthesis
LTESQGYSTAIQREPTVIDVATVLLRRWRLVVGLPATTAVLTFVISLVVRPTFTATATFVPEAGKSGGLPTGLASIAGQFGLSFGADASRSPRFYADVLKSRELLERVLRSGFADPRTAAIADDSVPLLALLKIRGYDYTDSLEHGVRALRRVVATQVDNQTSMVRLSVSLRYPGLAAVVANRFIEYLNAFNTQTRQSQARERRKFVEDRIAAAERELRNAESDLRVFYERNRSWQHSPQLVFEEGRLRRQVDIHQEVYLTLRREYEQARIEEVNDTPVITVIDSAVPPRERSMPRPPILALLGFFLGGTIGVTWAFIATYLDKIREHNSAEYRELRDALQGISRDVRQTVSRVFRARQQ